MFYPKVNTPVCASEILAYTKHLDSFEKRETALMFSSDAETGDHVLFFERNKEKSVTGYQILKDGCYGVYPYYLEDDDSYILEKLGALADIDNGQNYQPQRLTLIIDENYIIRYAEIGSFYVGRNPKEHIRILDALQTGELCSACREEGETTLGAYQHEL